MIKREELSNPESCMSRALPDERTFVLLARDETAPKVIREWARLRCLHGKNSVKDPQIVEALECADLMDIERPFVRFELAGNYAQPVADTPDPVRACRHCGVVGCIGGCQAQSSVLAKSACCPLCQCSQTLPKSLQQCGCSCHWNDRIGAVRADPVREELLRDELALLHSSRDELLAALKDCRDVLVECADDTAGTPTASFFKIKAAAAQLAITRAESPAPTQPTDWPARRQAQKMEAMEGHRDRVRDFGPIDCSYARKAVEKRLAAPTQAEGTPE